MKLVDLIPLQEIEFASQKSFDTYSKNHKLRPTTKVKIAGKTTTAGQASKVKGTSVFGGDKKPDDKSGDYPVGSLRYRLQKNNPKDAVKYDNQLKTTIKDYTTAVQNHLNVVSGGNGYTQKDEGGAITYNMGDGDMPTYTLYMGKEGNKHRITLEPTYGNDPKKLQGKIDKSFDNPKDAIKFMGDVAKKHRKELEMDDDTEKSKDSVDPKIKKQLDTLHKQKLAAQSKLNAFRKSYKDNYSKASKEKQKKMDADLKAAEKEFDKVVTPLEMQSRKLEKKDK
jgi:hypothetical protein